MVETKHFSQARAIIDAVSGHPQTIPERCQQAISLAGFMLQDAKAIQTNFEKKQQEQLSRMMRDSNGKLFVTSVTDQCFRSTNSERIANQLNFLIDCYGLPQFLPLSKRLPLSFFHTFGNLFPNALVPLAKKVIQKETKSVILPGEPDELLKHMEQRHAEGIRVNLNHLGEAILGEDEANRKLKIYLEDLAKPEIEYISVKISTICSQINQLAWENTLSIITDRLKQLYRYAQNHLYTKKDGTTTPKFVNLDMEEYRDLNITVDAFCRALDDPEFHNHSAGIVLQCYLPDSFLIQKKLTAWAKQRLAQGKAPIKIRIVKGANLAMEKVEASLREWPQAPYEEKVDTDANFKRMLIYGLDPSNAPAAHIGVGSHNLFDIAFAMLLRAENHVEDFVCFEMLEGMADHMRRVVQKLSGDMLLYCPAATKEEFQNAVAYLVRRLDENTAPENFLRAAFDMQVGSSEWHAQARLFKEACDNINSVRFSPRRTQDRSKPIERPPVDEPFSNEPDTDWSQAANRLWADGILEKWSQLSHRFIPLVIGEKEITTDNNPGIGVDPSSPNKTLYKYSLADKSQIDQALEIAASSANQWTNTPVRERSRLLAEVAHGLRNSRDNLIGAMIADTGKTIPESDVEVSEAIDFAEYYRRNIEEISTLEDVRWHSKGTILVAPPWNFPCSIPAGGILAALAAGNCVIFKPAREAVLVGWQLAQIFWDAGIDKSVLQFITCEDDPVGSALIQDPRIASVILTGATSTAKHFFKLRPGLDLIAETGGKNAMIITSLADRDLAIKDLVQSAFGHAGQKCSACSLAICEAEVYDDPHFLQQLRDAAASWHVGSQWDPATRLNPLIHEPNPTLLRGLTSLEEGEEWLLEPKQSSSIPNLWGPGIKLGVKPSSFTYQNELFGPVLGIMRAENLMHALELANGTSYGLTAGLHSLDKREHHVWLENIHAGNLYINRGITGAIVQRQPFGGFKESCFGPGAKAGGPNYVMQLMRPEQISLPSYGYKADNENKAIQYLTEYLSQKCNFDSSIMNIWEASICSYTLFWENYFIRSHDLSHVLGQDNLLYYLPHPQLVLRVQPEDDYVDVLRSAAAMTICQGKIEISGQASHFMNELQTAPWLKHVPNMIVSIETEQQFISRINRGAVNRVRLFSKPGYELELAIADAACNVTIAPVIANGRIELMHYLRDGSISIDYHRYGYLGDREGEFSCTQESQGCCGGGCE